MRAADDGRRKKSILNTELNTESNTALTGFAALGITGNLLKSTIASGFAEPKPIQVKAIPPHLAGRDIIAIAQTGSGKTAAFSLPILTKIIAIGAKRLPKTARALILAPTRELAVQIEDTIKVLAKGLHISTALVLGGVSRGSQVKKMQAGVDILIATPGRLTDLVREGEVKLNETRWLVLDEADRMLDMGFINDVRRLSKATHPERQTALYSATMPDEIAELAKTLLKNPVRVEAAPPAATATEIKQGLVIARDKSQNARQKALNDFREGSVRILVATDIAARGIDVPGISHVVNYDLPDEPECYVHRIGRTGRNGADGVAITLCDPAEFAKLRAVERITRMKIAVIADHTDQPDPAVNKNEPREAPYRDPRSQPRQENGNRNHKGGNRGHGKPGGAHAGAPSGERKPFRGKRRGFGGKPATRAA